MTSNVLLVSDGMVHPSLLGRFWLRWALWRLPGLRLRRVRSLEALPQLPLERFQGMVLYFHHNTLSEAALIALDDFVQRGGGVLAVHSATASFKEEDRYFEILGGQFSNHGPIQTIEVLPALPQDPTFGPISPFHVRDELYRHEYDPGNQVHFYAEIAGEREPIVWTRRHGQGRVSYLSLGHCAGTMRHPAVQAILQRGLTWACGEKQP
jgi:type 1 glutamine amidotransferase